MCQKCECSTNRFWCSYVSSGKFWRKFRFFFGTKISLFSSEEISSKEFLLKDFNFSSEEIFPEQFLMKNASEKFLQKKIGRDKKGKRKKNGQFQKMANSGEILKNQNLLAECAKNVNVLPIDSDVHVPFLLNKVLLKKLFQ